MATGEQVREDDQFRDSVGSPEVSQPPDNFKLESDEVPFTDPTTRTVTKTYTVAAKAAGADHASAAAVTIDNDKATVTSVTYTPAGSQAAPSAGNSRTWLVTGAEGTVGSYTFSSVSAPLASGVAIAFAIGTSVVAEQQLNFQSTEVASGAADPGGTLTVVYTF